MKESRGDVPLRTICYSAQAHDFLKVLPPKVQQNIMITLESKLRQAQLSGDGRNSGGRLMTNPKVPSGTYLVDLHFCSALLKVGGNENTPSRVLLLAKNSTDLMRELDRIIVEPPPYSKKR